MPTKWGPHVLKGAEDLGDYLKTQVAVAKFVGEWGQAKDVLPGVMVIGRRHQGAYDAQGQRTLGKTPKAAAEQFVQDQASTYQSNPHILYWEGHNEPVFDSREGMAWYAQFEVERMRLMADLRLRCVIGNFASGSPDLSLWPAFLPAMQAAQQFKALLGLHEYSCPWMWWMTGKHQMNPNEDQGDEGWTTLRYRKIYRQHFIPNGVGNVPLVITESGIDPLINPKPAQAGAGGTWKQLGGFWSAHDNEHDKADYYFRQLVWYDQELQKDDYVVGATLFTWGSFGPPWSDFDVAGSDVAKKLIAYTKQNPARAFDFDELVRRIGGPKDDKEGIKDEATAARGKPREQYKRTYVLLPPQANAQWARAVLDVTWDQKGWTVGSSADDAGIGDLDKRIVIAVNPAGWPSDLKAFFETFYPGVEYRTLVADSPAQLKSKLAALVA